MGRRQARIWTYELYSELRVVYFMTFGNGLLRATTIAFAILALAVSTRIPYPEKIVVYHFTDSVQADHAISIDRVRAAYSDKISINDGARIKNIVRRLGEVRISSDSETVDARWVIDGIQFGQRTWSVAFDASFSHANLGGHSYNVTLDDKQGLRALLSCIP
jgi:hypothetical protein